MAWLVTEEAYYHDYPVAAAHDMVPGRSEFAGYIGKRSEDWPATLPEVRYGWELVSEYGDWYLKGVATEQDDRPRIDLAGDFGDALTLVYDDGTVFDECEEQE